jgi:hypothetical protein
MSDRDFLDLDEELLDDSPDAPVGEWDNDLTDDFPADDPAAADKPAAAPAPPPTVSESRDKGKAKKVKKAQIRPPRRSGGGTGGTGVLCFVLVLLSGVTLAAGLMTAVGAAPEALLDFSGFQDPVTITDFQANPTNAFWLAAAVTLLAAVMTGVAVSQRMRGLSTSTDDQDDVLDAIRQLDPEQPETWQREELQRDPDLAAVTGALLGHYKLQQAKLQRYVGVEGELHRLEKALVDENGEELQRTWENPAVGSLADQALQLLQRHQAASRDASQSQASLAEQGADLVSGLRDARSWQSATLDQVKHQGSGIERIFRRLGKLAASPAEGGEDLAPRRERLRQAIVAVREELEAMPASTDGDGATAILGTLVERASRLAFQIAMEVARLGAKGERLLPLTQDLEELTTELRAVMDRSRSNSGVDEARHRALEKVRGRLAELDPEVLESAGDDRTAAVAELAPLAGEVAAGLANLTKTFGVQHHRIREMLNLASGITGIEVGEGGDPDAAPGSGILVDNHDPFASGGSADGGLMADPFSSDKQQSIFDTETPQSGAFAHTVLPGQEEQLRTAPDEPEGLGLMPENQLVLDDAPTAPVEDADAADEPAPLAVGPGPLDAETSPLDDEATPLADEATPLVDEATPLDDEATPLVDEATPLDDEATPLVDEATPLVDEATPLDDEATPLVDEATPLVDEATPLVDEAAPLVDEPAASNDEPSPFPHEPMMTFDEAPAASDEAIPAVADSALPSTEEKVYDLSEFDALSLKDEEPAAQDDGEHIYDLNDLGAVKIG